MNGSQTAPELLPFVAPCRPLGPAAPLRWLRLGWRDLTSAPRQSLAFGLGIAAVSALVSGWTYYYGSGWLLRLKLADPAEIDGLLDAAAYAAVCEAESN